MSRLAFVRKEAGEELITRETKQHRKQDKQTVTTVTQGEREERQIKAGRGNEPLERLPHTQQIPHQPSSPLAGPIWAGPQPTVTALTPS